MRSLLLLTRIREQEGQHPLTGLRQDPAGLVRRHAPPIRKAIEMLLRLPNVHLVGVETEDAYGCVPILSGLAAL
jgi:hypothetical protein